MHPKIFVIKGEKVYLVQGEVFNIKITYPYDLRVAESLIPGSEKEINGGAGYVKYSISSGCTQTF